MKKILNKRNGIMVIAGIVLIVAAAIYVITRPVTLDLKDYLQYEMEGFDGKASIYVSLDEDTLAEDMLHAAEKKGKSTQYVYYSLLDDMPVGIKASPNENLKNGDKVKVTYLFDDKKLKEKYGIKFKKSSDTIKVEGLEKAKEVDVFANLNIEFRGSAPNAYTDPQVTVTVDGASFTCSVSPYQELNIGDELTIECQPEDASIPIIPKETKTTIQVPDTVSHYVLDPAELTVDDMSKFKNSVKVLLESNEPFEGWFSSADIFVNCIADTGNKDNIPSEYCTISNIKIANEAYFFGGFDSGSPENKCMMRYELDATVSEENRDDYGTVYHCYGFCYVEDIIREGDRLTFDGAQTVTCSELYTAEVDRENNLKDDYADSWNKLTEYSVTLDGSKKPELTREATNQYESR
ncbi:MAG: hypothetical protein SO023_00440 [Eubacterium sp.]|nr:hypothetical protein [Eubacterium sp.]